ncbi:MAG: EcsC family protein [Bacteroidota bacterium]
MDHYDNHALKECKIWQMEMARPPGVRDQLTKAAQVRINRLYPEKVHQVITAAIKNMVKAVIEGADFTNRSPENYSNWAVMEEKVKERVKFYSTSAAAEGIATGYGGILLTFADLPLWLTLKMKMLFELAALYGYDTSKYRERLFILYIFQIAFCSQQQRNKTLPIIKNWNQHQNKLPNNINDFDWRTFQIEYRDYLDIAKLFQMIPGFGAIVGGIVNHTHTQKLGRYAMNAYRSRLLDIEGFIQLDPLG